ncbi:22817_t:CDS:2 [Cetraspora pellucida]|uniref:22817_t:CDS:1 n=1 Tax=Cetraspora pellucida TaxID=1433469 RepID=A0A9N9N5A1_9GLOM|nr:22817_t:CDS:2 [Cetraspora pellucida]
MRDAYEEESNIAIQQNHSSLELQMIFDNNLRLDQCCYNIPRVNEVAAVLLGLEDKNFPSHCLAICPYSDQLTTIPVINKHCDPMSYLLLFPRGDIGWHSQMPNSQRNAINSILHAKSLFQQYLVDVRLSDYLTTATEERGVVPGCAIVLNNGMQVLDLDKISAYINTCYISAPEAFWRLSEYKMQEKSHTIIRLPIYLLQKHNVYFTAENKLEILRNALNQTTMLTAWFDLNKEDSNAKMISYHDILLRMYSVFPSDIKCFWLRLLLLHTPGALGFKDLKTVNDIDKTLSQFYKSLEKDFLIPYPTTINVPNNENLINTDQEKINVKRMYFMLNNEQKCIVDKIMATVNRHNNNKCIFVDELGGTGKTFLTLSTTNDEIEIPVQCISVGDLVADVFNDVLKNNDEKILLSTVILCPKNQMTLDVKLLSGQNRTKNIVYQEVLDLQ